MCCHWVDNLKSVAALVTAVFSKIQKEISEGRVACPFPAPAFSNFLLSPLGVVPKKEVNEYRHIHHLSFSNGSCLNDQIDASLSSVSYTSYEQALSVYWP